MRKLQTQGCHHITLVGADRQTSVCFQGPLGLLIELASEDRSPKAAYDGS